MKERGERMKEHTNENGNLRYKSENTGGFATLVSNTYFCIIRSEGEAGRHGGGKAALARHCKL